MCLFESEGEALREDVRPSLRWPRLEVFELLSRPGPLVCPRRCFGRHGSIRGGGRCEMPCGAGVQVGHAKEKEVVFMQDR